MPSDAERLNKVENVVADVPKLIDKVDKLITQFAIYAERHENTQEAIKRLGERVGNLQNKTQEQEIRLTKLDSSAARFNMYDSKIVNTLIGILIAGSIAGYVYFK